MPPSTRVIGAYAAQPDDPALRPEFVQRVLELDGVTGLEIPFGAAVYRQDEEWLWRSLPRGGRHVFTLIGATMEALGADPAFGLASDDDAARAAALQLLAAARDAVAQVAAAGQQVTAVCLHTAPRRVVGAATGNGAALRASLREAAAWDWGGAALVVEHCDAPVGDRPVQKGFLPLADEIAAVAEVAAAQSNTPVGLSVNWGRSAIEARSAAGPLEHLAQARAAGVLVGFVLSGAGAEPGAYGPAWQDAHLALRGSADDGGEPTSLLTPQLAAQALRSAGDGLLFDGVKLAVRPQDATLEQRLAMVRRAWDALVAQT